MPSGFYILSNFSHKSSHCCHQYHRHFVLYIYAVYTVYIKKSQWYTGINIHFCTVGKNQGWKTKATVIFLAQSATDDLMLWWSVDRASTHSFTPPPENDRILVKVSDGDLMDLHQKSAQGQGHVCYSLWTLVLISLCSTANRWQENWSLFFSTSRYNNRCAPVFQMHLILGSCWKFVARVVCCHFEYIG